MEIKTIQDLKDAIRQGRYSSIGSYPLFFLASDGGTLSWDSVRENLRECFDAIKRQDSTGGWLIVGHDANLEDPSMFCSHSGDRIESAYADDHLICQDCGHHDDEANFVPTETCGERLCPKCGSDETYTNGESPRCVR